MIRFENVTIAYADALEPVLQNVDLHVPEGELCLVIGRTGSGKSTLLQAVNGLVPHFTGGTLLGKVSIAGRDTKTHPPRELADVIEQSCFDDFRLIYEPLMIHGIVVAHKKA